MADDQPRTKPKNELMAAIADTQPEYLKLAAKSNIALAFEREAMYARRIVMNSWQLQEANPKSVFDCILDAASIGFTLSPELQHATIIPRNVNIGTSKNPKWETRAFLMPMYRGLVWLATNDGVVLAIESDVVWQKDIDAGGFKLVRGNRPILEHTPYFGKDRTTGGDADFIGAWVKATIAKLGPDYPQIGFMPAEDIFKARDGSKAYRDKKTNELEADAPWRKWFGEQAKKTAVKREQKLWPHSIVTSQRLSEAIAMDDRANVGDTPAPRAETVESEVLLISHDQTETLTQMLARSKLRPETFMQAFEVERLDDLPQERYAEATERLQRRISEVEKPAEREPGSDDNIGEELPLDQQ